VSAGVRVTAGYFHGPRYDLSLARVSEPVASSGQTIFCGEACAPSTQAIASFNTSRAAILVQSRSMISQASRGCPHES
jgi:hypothetical protein